MAATSTRTATVLIGPPLSGKDEGARKRGIKAINPMNYGLLFGPSADAPVIRTGRQLAEICRGEHPACANGVVYSYLAGLMLGSSGVPGLEKYQTEALDALLHESELHRPGWIDDRRLHTLLGCDGSDVHSRVTQLFFNPAGPDQNLQDRVFGVIARWCVQPVLQEFRTEYMGEAIRGADTTLELAIATGEDIALTACNSKPGDLKGSLARLVAAGYNVVFHLVGRDQTRTENELNNLRRFLRTGIYIPARVVERKRSEITALFDALGGVMPTTDSMIRLAGTAVLQRPVRTSSTWRE